MKIGVSQTVKYCSKCGSKTVSIIPDGDNRMRDVCAKCGEIHYQNPKVVAGCLPIWKDKILICQRAIQPRRGYWTIPAGYLENDETILQGALRETREEACAEVENTSLYQIYNLSPNNQIYMLYLGYLKNPKAFAVGIESLDVKLVAEYEIPWSEIAFKVIKNTLRRYLEERKSGQFTLQVGKVKL